MWVNPTIFPLGQKYLPKNFFGNFFESSVQLKWRDSEISEK